MSGQACTPNIFSADIAAIAAIQPETLPHGYIFGGILEQLEPVGSSLVRVRIFQGAEYLVDEALFPKLLLLVGKPAVIGHINGKWQAEAKSVWCRL